MIVMDAHELDAGAVGGKEGTYETRVAVIKDV